MVEHFGYDFGDPVLEASGWWLSYQVITFENTYGLDPDCVQRTRSGTRHELSAVRLM